VQILERILAPTAVLVTLGYFFGRQYTAAVVSYFGVEVSALEMSPDEFVLRSADAIFLPLGALAAISLLLLYGHVRVVLHGLARCAARTPGSNEQRRLRQTRRSLQVFGLLLLGYGIVGRFVPVPGLDGAYLPSVASAAGALTVAYGEFLRDAERNDGRRIRWRDHPTAATVARFLVGSFVAFNIFFAASSYAQHVGTERAEVLAANLQSRPAATVYSAEDLSLAGPGVVATPLPAGGYFKIRYRGLRLLSLTGANYLLLPAKWTRAEGPAVLLQKSDKIRIEFD